MRRGISIVASIVFVAGTAMAVAVPSGVASAAAPSLSGEVLTGTDIAGTCPPPGDAGSVPYTASGTATGPYPGTFTETGYWELDLEVLSAFHASYTITSGSTTISGTADYATTTFAACDGRMYNEPATYVATVTSPGGTTTDHGTASVNIAYGSFDQSFTSTGGGGGGGGGSTTCTAGTGTAKFAPGLTTTAQTQNVTVAGSVTGCTGSVTSAGVVLHVPAAAAMTCSTVSAGSGSSFTGSAILAWSGSGSSHVTVSVTYGGGGSATVVGIIAKGPFAGSTLTMELMLSPKFKTFPPKVSPPPAPCSAKNPAKQATVLVTSAGIA
jgi:hypothetical protein